MKRLIFVVLVVLLMSDSASADGLRCLAGSYLSQMQTPGSGRELKLVGSVAYIADREGGLTIIDVSDPYEPVQIGSYNNGTALAVDVDVVGGMAYVVTYSEGLQIIDVTDPASPVLIGMYASTEPMFDVRVVDSVAYIACYTDGLIILDVSVPAQPTMLSATPTKSTTFGLDIVGETLYLADGSSGIRIFDMVDPSNPMLLGEIETANAALAVVVENGLAHVTEYFSGYHIMDVSNPADPVSLSFTYVDTAPRSVEVVADRAFVVNGQGGTPSMMRIFDISDPADPVLETSYATAGPAYGISIIDSIAYVAVSEGGLQVFDVSNPINAELDRANASDDYNDVAVLGDVAYALVNGSRLDVFDVSDPTNLVLIDEISLNASSVQELALVGDRLYISNLGRSVLCYDVGDPLNPVAIGHFNSEYKRRFDMVGDTAFLVGDMLEIVDLSDLDHPVVLSTSKIENITLEVEVVGSMMYLAQGFDGIALYDVSDPSNPVYVASVAFDVDYYNGLTVRDQIAYVGNNRSGMQVIDLHDPLNPVLLDQIDTPWQAFDVVLDGTQAMVNDFSGLVLVDVSLPGSARMLAAAHVPYGMDRIAVADDLCFGASFQGFVSVDLGGCDQCIVDMNNDGRLNFFDISIFLDALVSRVDTADINSDGRWNFFDISAFLDGFAQGCP